MAARDMNAAVLAESGPPAIAKNRDVTIGAVASRPVRVDGVGGDATVALPATGRATQIGRTKIFDAPGAWVGAQATREGFRVLVRIDSAAAPQRYDYVVGSDASSLRAEPDGSVTVLNVAGKPIGHIAKPWARDANGAAIPTRYDIDGGTLTQVVRHRGAGVAYPIVADPFWSTPGKWSSARARSACSSPATSS